MSDTENAQQAWRFIFSSMSESERVQYLAEAVKRGLSPEGTRRIVSDTERTPPATDEDVRAAWRAWAEPGDDRWTPERFDRWLATHDAKLITRVRAEQYEASAARPLTQNDLDAIREAGRSDLD